LDFIRADARRQQAGHVGAASQVAHVTASLDHEVFGLDEKMTALCARRGGRRPVLGEVCTK